MKKKCIIEIVAIIAISVVAGAMSNAISSNGISWVGQWDTDKGVITAMPKDEAEVFQAGLEIYDLTQVKAMFDSGEVLFIDARSEGQFSEGRIPGARLLSAFNIEGQVMTFMDEVPVDRRMIIYCSGRECPSSHEVASVLKEFGYENLHVFVDGFPAWEDEGYPIEK